MATITLGSYGVDQRDGLSLVGRVVLLNSTTIEIESSDGHLLRATGSFNSQTAAGTINGYEFYLPDSILVFQVSGINLSTATYNNFVNQGDVVGLNNYLFGGSDRVDGGLGSDVIVDSSGSDLIFGSAGLDTVVLDASRADSIVTLPAADSLTVSHGGQIDSLDSIERLQFSDQAAMAFDTEGVAGQAYRLYKAAFDRAPDEEGLGYWIDEMDDGMALTGVSYSFIDSSEFNSTYGPLDDQGFISALYQNVLDRAPDAEGYAYWLDEIERGVIDRAGMLASFSESAENKANVVDLIANGINYEVWAG